MQKNWYSVNDLHWVLIRLHIKITVIVTFFALRPNFFPLDSTRLSLRFRDGDYTYEFKFDYHKRTTNEMSTHFNYGHYSLVGVSSAKQLSISAHVSIATSKNIKLYVTKFYFYIILLFIFSVSAYVQTISSMVFRKCLYPTRSYSTFVHRRRQPKSTTVRKSSIEHHRDTVIMWIDHSSAQQTNQCNDWWMPIILMVRINHFFKSLLFGIYRNFITTSCD